MDSAHLTVVETDDVLEEAVRVTGWEVSGVSETQKDYLQVSEESEAQPDYLQVSEESEAQLDCLQVSEQF